MRCLPVTVGRGALTALVCLSFGVVCSGAPPVAALEYAAANTTLLDPAADIFENRPVRSTGLHGTVPMAPSGKWTLGFDGYTAQTFAEIDSRESQLKAYTPVSPLTGARVQVSGHDLFFVDDKLSLSIGVPLQATTGRVNVLNNVFVRRKRDMRVRDLVLSLLNEEMWSVAAAHQLPLAYRPLNFGYGVYAQFRGAEFQHVGLGFSSRLRF